MKTRILILFATLGLIVMSTGCYTKLYRPGMEDNGPFSQNTLYNRYDSTAIDTTLEKPEYTGSYAYPQDYYYYDNWSSWGRPRGVTRWGFDFNRFSPNYYWGYYGYYDYYGRPWWQDWNHHNHGGWWGPGGNGEPGEPPSQRPGRRSGDLTPPAPTVGGNFGSGGAVYQQPNPTPTTPGNPSKDTTPPTVKNPPAPTPPPSDDSGQKRNGKRRR